MHACMSACKQTNRSENTRVSIPNISSEPKNPWSKFASSLQWQSHLICRYFKFEINGGLLLQSKEVVGTNGMHSRLKDEGKGMPLEGWLIDIPMIIILGEKRSLGKKSFLKVWV